MAVDLVTSLATAMAADSASRLVTVKAADGIGEVAAAPMEVDIPIFWWFDDLYRWLWRRLGRRFRR
jgi:hypothetical protein